MATLSGTRMEAYSKEKAAQRNKLCTAAKKAPFMRPDQPKFWHGRLYDGPGETPNVTWPCSEPPRDDHDCPEWLTASEFEDQSDAFHAKCQQLAQLMRISKRTVLYTGAGISASVVGQAARSGANTQGWKEGGGRYAKPTATHFLLGYLGRAGFIDEWVQQNHDGLPQKAGFPQEKINEVHGSWYDPSNPVVKYGGSLRDHEAAWMKGSAEKADLVIVLGTSLGGLNADQVATKAAQRSLRGKSLGTVCINLQQTPQDEKMSLRIFGKSDDVLSEVCKCLKEDLVQKLGLEEGKLSMRQPAWAPDDRVLVPYDANGHLLTEPDAQPWMWLDFRCGKKVRITDDHNIQGCKQPGWKHLFLKPGELLYGVERQDVKLSPGNCCMDIRKSGLVSAVRDGPAKEKGVQVNWIMRKIITGGTTKDFSPELLREVALHGTADYTAVFDVPRAAPASPLTGTVTGRDNKACCFNLEIGRSTFHLGVWWLEAAARGAPEFLPVMNENPEFEAPAHRQKP